MNSGRAAAPGRKILPHLPPNFKKNLDIATQLCYIFLCNIL